MEASLISQLLETPEVDSKVHTGPLPALHFSLPPPSVRQMIHIQRHRHPMMTLYQGCLYLIILSNFANLVGQFGKTSMGMEIGGNSNGA